MNVAPRWGASTSHSCGIEFRLFTASESAGLVFTYWLRGIDLPSIFVMMAICFIEVAVAINMATFIACLPSGRVIKILLGILVLFVFLFAFFGTVGMSYPLASSGWEASFISGNSGSPQ